MLVRALKFGILKFWHFFTERASLVSKVDSASCLAFAGLILWSIKCYFSEIAPEVYIYGNYLVDLSSAIVSYWRKDVH